MSPFHALVLAAHISVAICGAEQVPAPLLEKAEQIAADVYRDIGVAIEWSEECRDDALAVHLIPTSAAGIAVNNITLGFAEPGGFTASVLSDRLVSFSRRYGVKRDALLGYTIAHELGHLLLPPHSHSHEGLMRSNLDVERANAKRLRFTQEQGALILRKLESVQLMALATN
jgi:predicted Zn-dependent protease